MTDPTQPPVEPVRLLLDFGESVEVDGSMLYDPVAEKQVPAVVLRMPRHRAAWFGLVLNAYTRVCQLVGADVIAAERGPAWALDLAARSAGHIDAAPPSPVHRVTSGRRLAAAAVLRSAESLDDTTTIAVVDAVTRWLDEPDGEEYAYALLGAVTDGQAQQRAYAELLGARVGWPPLAAHGLTADEELREPLMQVWVLTKADEWWNPEVYPQEGWRDAAEALRIWAERHQHDLVTRDDGTADAVKDSGVDPRAVGARLTKIDVHS